MTQQELANAVGVTVRTAQHWEAGSYVPYRNLDKIAAVVGRDAEWLLYGDGGDEPISRIEAASAEIAEAARVVAESVQKLSELLRLAQAREQEPPPRE